MQVKAWQMCLFVWARSACRGGTALVSGIVVGAVIWDQKDRDPWPGCVFLIYRNVSRNRASVASRGRKNSASERSGVIRDTAVFVKAL